MVINNVRIESNEGWYIGSLEFENGGFKPCGRNSGYYYTEELLENGNRNTISLVDAFHEAVRLNWISRHHVDISVE